MKGRRHRLLWSGVSAFASLCSWPALAAEPTEEMQIVAQLCLPAGAADSLHWLPMDELRQNSIGTVSGSEIGLTRSQQRVFELQLSEPGYSRFLILSLDASLPLVYVVPGKFVAGEWSEWRAAEFQSSNPDLQFILLRDQRIPDRSAAPATAPRIRYRVMPYGEFQERARRRLETGAERDIPAC